MNNKIIHRIALVGATLFLLNSCSPSTGNSQDKKTSFSPTESDEPVKWELAWSDEFDYKGHPDSSKWDYEVGYIRNDEKQYNTERRLENARVVNGHLIIEARKKQLQKSSLHIGQPRNPE
ncbi:MAG: hypothetical protein U5K69_12320 [Balneolaceae bacterium]|nr:hypothetical protein [Balneolaceae bacterium]